MAGILDLLKNIGKSKVPPPIAPSSLSSLPNLDKDELRRFEQLGVVVNDMSALISQQLQVAYERGQLYRELSSMQVDAICSGALNLYASTATTPTSSTNKTIWVESHDKKYENEGNAFFDDILGIEDRIFDWVMTLALYGDHFLEPYGEPGAGIIAVNDNHHPSEWGRVDYMGKLIGFYKTPLAILNSNAQMVDASQFETKLLPPWHLVHARISGPNKKLMSQDYQYGVFSAAYLISKPNAEGYAQFQSRYGQSVLFDGLVPYKRYRLGTDSLMMARQNRSVLKYLYKIAMDPNATPEQAASILDSYKAILKRARQMDTSGGPGNYRDFFSPMGAVEDLIIAVFGNVDDLKVEKLGGDVDIKWIADIDEMRNQLVSALGVPLALLGGYSNEGAPPSLGNGSLESISINFARRVRRLQRAMIVSMTRMLQIHFAYLGMDPDVKMFEVKMNTTSTAEELQLQDALDKGSDTVQKAMDLIKGVLGKKTDMVKLLNYFNKKILKLEDLNLEEFVITETEAEAETPAEEEAAPEGAEELAPGPAPLGSPGPEPAEEEHPDLTIKGPKEAETEGEPIMASKSSAPFVRGTDVTAPLPVDVKLTPLTEKKEDGTIVPMMEMKEGKEVQKMQASRINERWEEKYGSTQIKINVEPIKR